MEKPFYLGESIAPEQTPFTKLSVEDEIKMVLESKQALDENALIQDMKELGTKRSTSRLLCLYLCFVNFVQLFFYV